MKKIMRKEKYANLIIEDALNHLVLNLDELKENNV